MKHLSLACASAVAFAAAALSQGPDDAASQRPSPAPTTLLPTPSGPDTALDAIRLSDPFTVPIHTAAADNGFAYGTWASGPNYKVSFDGQMAFYPILGDRYPHNLPVGWRTIGVQVGAQNLLAEGELAAEAHGEWHYEYRYGNLTERYDLLPEGVEQSFVIHRRPVGEGDLVIRGALDTELQAEPRASMVGAIVFRDRNGTPVVDYGAALAIDAEGRKQPMETAYDGSHVTLRLDAGWLKTASFPLTVDPLLANVVVATGSGAPRNPSVGRDDAANQLLTSYGRVASATDIDLYARTTDDSYAGTSTVFTDVTATWSTPYSDVAFVGGPTSWIIVFQRDFTGTTGSWIRYHTRASGDPNLSTVYHGLAGSSGNTLSSPEVGGTDSFSTGDHALVVYQSDAGLNNTSSSAVVGRLVNVSTSSVGTAIDLESRAQFDCETPSVNQVSSGGSESWICCWAELNQTINDDDWDITIKRVRSNGTINGASFVGDASATDHAYQPKIAGRAGRYAVVFGGEANGAGTQVNGWGTSIEVHRFDWSEAAAGPTKFDIRTVRSSRTVEFWCGDIAYDDITDSHWAVVYHSNDFDVYTARVGYDGGVCESATVYNTSSSGFSPSVTIDNDNNRFAISFATIDSAQTVYGARFNYPTFSQPILYGVGCGPATLGSNSNSHSRKPHEGAEFFEARVQSVPSNALGALNIGLSADGQPLSFLPGCFLNVGTMIASLPASASGTTATVPLPIPSGVHGDLFLQYIYVDPGFANPIPVRTTRGLQVFVR